MSDLRLSKACLFAFTMLGGTTCAMAQDTGVVLADDPLSVKADDLDLAAPLAPLDGFDIAWPDMSPEEAEAIPQVVAPASGMGDVAQAPATNGASSQDAAVTQATDISDRRYSFSLNGMAEVIGEGWKPAFDLESTLRAGEGQVANSAQIDRRVREDEELLIRLLRDQGYYDVDVSTEIQNSADNRLAIAMTVEPGTLYRFEAVTVRGLPADRPQEAVFPLKAGDAVDSAQIVTAMDQLENALTDHGYAFASLGTPDIVVDHDTTGGQFTMDVAAGEQVTFGAFQLKGERLFSRRHLERIARFRQGDLYQSSDMADFRSALIATSLVSSVRLKPVPTTDPKVVDIEVALEKAPPRTIAAEIGYGTGQGARLEASWTHRNFFSPEGAVTFRGIAGTQEQLLGASLRRSNFKKRDQVLTAQASASHIVRDAFDARTVAVGVGLERLTNIVWQKKWTWSFGVEFLASDERDTVVATGAARRRTFYIAALPTRLSYDGSDDLLDPTEGFRLGATVSPEGSLQGRAFGYGRVQFDASGYLPISRNIVLAGRTRLATIVGAQRDSIAPSRRYYAGGGGSIRGYGYQAIGPKDIDGDPIGGRSLTEFAIEARIRFGDFSVVPFLDAGNLYTSPLPRMKDMRFGTGLGVRYHTSFGPIRVDVGTPVNRRSGDSRVAVYVSLGQAF